MAAAALAPTELWQDRASELCSCPICMEELQNGKVLPCTHTFCLPCLRNLTDTVVGANVPCPVCREPFSVPSDGLDSLKTNFFMRILLQINREGKSASQIGLA